MGEGSLITITSSIIFLPKITSNFCQSNIHERDKNPSLRENGRSHNARKGGGAEAKQGHDRPEPERGRFLSTWRECPTRSTYIIRVTVAVGVIEIEPRVQTAARPLHFHYYRFAGGGCFFPPGARSLIMHAALVVFSCVALRYIGTGKKGRPLSSHLCSHPSRRRVACASAPRRRRSIAEGTEQ